MRPARRIVRWLLPPVALLVVANLVAEPLAESGVARFTQRALKLDTRPEVSISAFPILLRLLQRRIPRVTLRAEGMRVEKLTLRSVAVDLEDLEFRVSLFGGAAPPSLHVRRGTVVAEIAEAAVNELLVPQHAMVEFHPGSVLVTARRVIAGRRRTIVATGKVSLRGDAVALTPTSVTVDGKPPPPSMEARARSEATLRIPLQGLPEGVTFSSVEALAGAIRLSASLSDVTFGEPAGSGSPRPQPSGTARAA